MIKDLKNQHGEKLKAARDLIDKAEAEKRNLSNEENAKYDTLMGEVLDVKARIDRLGQQEELEREAALASAPVATATLKPNGNGAKSTPDPRLATAEDVMNAYGRALVSGILDINLPFTNNHRLILQNALQQDDDEKGGFLSPPLEFMNRLIQRVDDLVVMRGLSTTFTVMKSDAVGAPSLDTDPDDPIWTAEIATGDEDNAMKFGMREMKPHPLAKRIKVSRKLLRTSALPVEQIVIDRLGYKFAITQENAFMTGDGANKPLGLFTASDQGISTARDVSTDNTTTSISFDNLHEVKYTLKGNYWPNSSWLFHRDAIKQISKLKDGQGNYVWRESVRIGEPDTILGLPVRMSEFVPNTFTTGQYVGMLGDYKNYWIVDALTLEMQRLVELYAETNQVGFIGRLETDGAPVLEEAFVRVQLA